MSANQQIILGGTGIKTKIQYIGFASGTTSATMPTHQSGDLLIMGAIRFGTAITDTLTGRPAGWTLFAANGSTVIYNSTFVKSIAMEYVYKIATSSSETTGTWGNSSVICVMVVRGFNATTPLGGKQYYYNNLLSTNIDYFTITFSNTSGTSSVVGMVFSNVTNSSLETPPSGMQNKYSAQVSGLYEVAVQAKDLASSWPTTNVSVGGSNASIGNNVFEILSS